MPIASSILDADRFSTLGVIDLHDISIHWLKRR